MKLPIKRVYDETAPGDGTRILVDRLWPRGVRKERVDLWLKDIAPSDALRHAFHGQPQHWEAFCAAYAAELGGASAQAALNRLRNAVQSGPVTLLYAARDEARNNAAALRDWLLLREG
ncbi:DUF488 family protein [Bosea sp. TND4EK4]|uniref:DUF488 domain-containing protein n=1 Tax=Bosea sp. TND4EK4 TaxID=1907408 RepID=UPI000956CC18|nr:DUF488 family protein [Bosea sp. TND4EK4]SIQ79467.1 Uncharacterized conserved protein YeaO, DUF488 family [Bosea sp. TND4EK4]